MPAPPPIRNKVEVGQIDGLGTVIDPQVTIARRQCPERRVATDVHMSERAATSDDGLMNQEARRRALEAGGR
jgi:hypothetical protein